MRLLVEWVGIPLSPSQARPGLPHPMAATRRLATEQAAPRRRKRGRERISKARMHRYQDSGKRNRRKGETEHVTSPVGQMPEGAWSFRAIVLTNEEWPQVLGGIYEVFHLVEGRFASASATAAYPNERPIDVRSWTGPGHLDDTSTLKPHRAGGNGGGCRKLAAKPGAGTIRGVIS